MSRPYSPATDAEPQPADLDPHAGCREREAAAIRAAVLAERERIGWQPIETAPEDDAFMVWQASHERVVTVQRMEMMGRDAVIEPFAGRWWRARYWMPLPKPPAPPAKEQG